MHYDEHMSANDAILWNNERDPMLRSTILSVMILDRPPQQERFDRAVERALGRVPRLRQHVVLDPLGVAPPVWRHDDNFDLAYHRRRLALPPGSDMRQLFDFAEPIVMQAFDRNRPLWEMYQVEGLDDGRCAILMKLHHAISDGVGLVRMTASLVERDRDEDPGDDAPRSLVDADDADTRGPFAETLGAIRYRAAAGVETANRVLAALGRGAVDWASDPAGMVRAALETAGSIGRTLRPVTEPMSPLMIHRSLGVRLDTLQFDLVDLKRAAAAVDGTLNCAFVAAVAGGLRRYHESHGAPVEELRMTMPINLRSGEHGAHAGNQFSPARFAVPVGIVDPGERMRCIASAVQHERNEPALTLIDDIAGVLSTLPTSVSVGLFGSMLKAIDFITSNVPGPPFPVFVSGAKVEHMYGFGPLSGAAANLTLFSYDGRVYVSINHDPAAVPDRDVFLRCMGEGFAEVLGVGA